MFGVWDHLLVLVIAVAWPLYTAKRSYPAFLRELAVGRAGARRRAYGKAIAFQWGLTLFVVLLWVVLGRPLPALGLSVAWRWQLGVGLGVLALLLLFLELQRRSVASNAATHEQVRAQLAYAEPLLPHGRHERQLFLILGITAGICEELLFRGYLMAYAEQWLGIGGSWLATSAVFGAAHLYLGGVAALRAGLVGGVAGGLYLFTGSLWVPMILHAALDVNAGQIADLVYGEQPEATQPGASRA